MGAEQSHIKDITIGVIVPELDANNVMNILNESLQDKKGDIIIDNYKCKLQKIGDASAVNLLIIFCPMTGKIFGNPKAFFESSLEYIRLQNKNLPVLILIEEDGTGTYDAFDEKRRLIMNKGGFSKKQIGILYTNSPLSDLQKFSNFSKIRFTLRKTPKTKKRYLLR